MELRLTGTNIEITPGVRRYVERKSAKLNRHFPNIFETRVEISEENTKSADQRYLVHLTVDAAGTIFHDEQRADEQFKAIDKVTDTMVRLLEDYKGKMYNKSKGVSVRTEEADEAEAATAEAAEQAETEPRVVKIKNFIIKPMALQEAIDQMETLGHDFFLFYDSEAEQMKLVYRRKDGDYGLIEPHLG